VSSNPNNSKKLDKALRYASMAVKIRCSVIESMTPAIPYLMRFKLSDYTYFVEYMRDRCMQSIYQAGLYEVYVKSAKELSDHLSHALGEEVAADDEITEAQILEYKKQLPNDKIVSGKYKFDENGLFVKTSTKIDDAMSANKKYTTPREMFEKLPLEGRWQEEEDAFGAKPGTEEYVRGQKDIVRAWLERPNAEAEAQQAEYANQEVGEPSEDPQPPEAGGKRTPYMLSNFYGNVWPIKKQRLSMATEEKGFWAKLRDFPFLTVNGVPMSPDQVLQAALIAMCFNLDAMGDLWNKMKPKPKPTRAFDEGALGFPSVARPKNLRGEDLLDAIIVLECTMFIQRIKSLKEDPENDWDFPMDYANVFFKRLLPKPTPQWLIDLHTGTHEPWKEPIMLDSLKHRKKIMYTPVFDVEDPEIVAEGWTTTVPRRADSDLLRNFPWSAADGALDGRLDAKDAQKSVWAPAFSPYAGIPTISTTLDAEYPTDKYNGGTTFFKRDWWADGENDPTAGRWMLQYFCKIDSELWEQVNPEDAAPPKVPLQSVETQGLRNLLYLFEHRSDNLKGHVNPHYWNASMNAFFNKLDEELQGGTLDFTEEDLKRFRQRHGAQYARVHMGLRLCWWVPSGMPHDHDAMEKFHAQQIPEGWTPSMGPIPKEIYKWYTKAEYGDANLIAAYKKINTNPAARDKMRKMFALDKAHAYVHIHQQQKVARPTPTDENPTKEEVLHEGPHGIGEYSFCFPVCEVLTDEPITLLAPGLDPEKPNVGDWQILDNDLTIEEPWNSDTTLNKLIKKMSKDPEFRILFEYIFPISSIIPEIATIYGMEFFKPVADYMNVRKRYFGGVRAASDAIIHSMEQYGNYNFDGSEEGDVSPLGSRSKK